MRIMPRLDLAFIAETLASAVESTRDQPRLKKGAAIRKDMMETLAAGKSFDHYRYRWLAESATKLAVYAQVLCKEFDAAHPDDMASSSDLSDILRTAHNSMKDDN